MLRADLRVKLGESLILGLPLLDLTLKLLNELVLGLELGADVGRDEAKLVLKSFDSLYVSRVQRRTSARASTIVWSGSKWGRKLTRSYCSSIIWSRSY